MVLSLSVPIPCFWMNPSKEQKNEITSVFTSCFFSTLKVPELLKSSVFCFAVNAVKTEPFINTMACVELCRSPRCEVYTDERSEGFSCPLVWAFLPQGFKINNILGDFSQNS